MDATTDNLDMMLVDIMRDTPVSVAEQAANAIGVGVDELRATRLGGISADQLHALCVALHRSSDDVLGIAESNNRTTDEPTPRELASLDLLDAVGLALDQLHGLACIMETMAEANTRSAEEHDVLTVFASVLRTNVDELEHAARTAGAFE